MSEAALHKNESHWGALIAAAAATVVVGFASTILVVIEGIKAMGADAAQQASAAAILCYGMAVVSGVLSWRYKMPMIVAWSTPGSVLLATYHGAVTFPQAIGAFMFAAVLMIITGLIKPVAVAIANMPGSIAAAMLAGVLLHYALGVPVAALDMPGFVLPLIIAFFALRAIVPMYTVPIIVALGLVFAFLSGGMSQPIPVGVTPLTFDVPQFNTEVLFGIGIPLFFVTMASQNLPGFAVLRAHGYEPPVQPALLMTGLASLVCAPFGSHALNMAAITAALAAGKEAHPDPQQRWKVIIPYFLMYIVFGLAAGTFVAMLGSLPKPLIAAVAGLALFAPLSGGMTAMMKEPKDIEPALVTFLVAASGISLFGVGAAFWGLVAGLALWGVKRVLQK